MIIVVFRMYESAARFPTVADQTSNVLQTSRHEHKGRCPAARFPTVADQYVKRVTDQQT